MWLNRVTPALVLLTLSCGGEVRVGDSLNAQPTLSPDERGCYLALDGQIRGVAAAQGELSGPCACSGSAVNVANASELANAMSGGGCVKLGAGSYGNVDVPAGVQLVGTSSVHTERLSLGEGASACGVSVSLGVDVRGRGAELKYASVTNAVTDGIEVRPDASLRLVGSTVTGSNRYGVSAFDAERVEVVDSLIEHNSGPGLWMQCGEGCDCDHASDLVMTNSLVTRNSTVGMSIVGVNAVLSRVQVTESTVGQNFQGGIGVVASGCSTLTADNLRVEDNADAGIVVSSSASAMDCVHAARNLRGIWYQSVTEAPFGEAALRRATVEDNEGVGIGLRSCAGWAQGLVTIEETRVANTHCISLPVLIGGVSAGAEEVCDGVLWDGDIEAHLRDVELAQNSRYALVINGPAQGTLHDVTVNESGPIVQLNYLDGPQPTVSGSTPPIETSPPQDPPVFSACVQ